jgi:hypothetical protein
MKKAILFTITFFLISICTFAQLDKRTWLVGGNGNIDFYNQDFKADYDTFTTKQTKINIDFSIGYFIKDKLVAGLRPAFSLENGKLIRNNLPDGGIYGKTRFYAGPFVRYYFLKKDKSFNIFSDLSYQFGVILNPTPTIKSKGLIKRFTASAGVELFFNSVVGMEILAGYKNNYEDTDYGNGYFYSDKKNSFQVNIGFQIHLQKD